MRSVSYTAINRKINMYMFQSWLLCYSRQHRGGLGGEKEEHIARRVDAGHYWTASKPDGDTILF